jgi:HEAT repeat protein
MTVFSLLVSSPNVPLEGYAIRWRAVAVLGRMRAKDAVPTLSRLLEDSDRDVRASATQSLQQVENPAMP